jgi:hypothetical protein
MTGVPDWCPSKMGNSWMDTNYAILHNPDVSGFLFYWSNVNQNHPDHN